MSRSEAAIHPLDAEPDFPKASLFHWCVVKLFNVRVTTATGRPQPEEFT